MCIGGTYGPVSRIRFARIDSAGRIREDQSSIWDGRCRSSQAAYLRRAQGQSKGSDIRALAGRLRVASGDTRRELGLSPRGVCLAGLVTETAGALLPHPFTPYRLRQRSGGGGTALCCTCLPHRAEAERCSAGNDAAFPLGSTVPCGVRTFLTAGPTACGNSPRHHRSRRSDNPIRTSKGKRRTYS